MNKGITIAAFLIILTGCTTTVTRGELAAEYYNLGNAYFELGDLERSAEFLLRAVELDPSLNRASYNLARVYIERGLFGRAEELLADLADQDPENVDVIATLAYLAYAEGNLEESAAHYRRAIEANPGSSDLLYNLGTVELELGDSHSAFGHYSQALRLAPNDAATLKGLARSEIALERGVEAIEHLEAYLRIESDDNQARLQLAGLYERDERFDRALERLDQIIDADDRSLTATALFRKASILLTAAEEPAAGIETLRDAFEAGYLVEEEVEALAERTDSGDAVRALWADYAPKEGEGEDRASPGNPPGSFGESDGLPADSESKAGSESSGGG